MRKSILPAVLIAASPLLQCASTQADITTGLVSRYAFDSPANPGLDSGGNNFQGTNSGVDIVDDPTRITAALFDSSDSITAPISTLSSSGFTVSLWVNRSATGNSVNNGLFTINDGNAANKTLGGWVNTSDQVWGRIIAGGTHDLPQDADSAIPDGTWSLVTFRGTGSSYQVFVDGVNTTNNVAYSGSFSTVINTLLIGRQGSESWNGRMDDFRVYNRALSDSDILELYNEPASDRIYANHVQFDINGSTASGTTQSGYTPVTAVGPTSTESLLTTLTINGALDEFRDRGNTASLPSSNPQFNLLRDFVFENDGQSVQLDLAGLRPFTLYQVTVYSYDSQNNGTKSEWYQDAISGSPLAVHTITSSSPSTAAFIMNLFADANGDMHILAQPFGGGSGIVIVNGIELTIIPAPAALPAGLALLGLILIGRRKNYLHSARS